MKKKLERLYELVNITDVLRKRDGKEEILKPKRYYESDK